MTSSLPRVAVIGTGGTISSWAESSLDSIDYPDFGRKLPVAEILDRFAETRLVADPSKAKALLGWEPAVSDLGTIMGSAWDWRLRYPNGYAGN